MSTPFIGYSGEVWQAVYAGLDYYQAQLAVSSSAASGVTTLGAVNLVALSEAMLATLQNATNAIDASQLATAWYYESVNLQAIQALPLGLDPTTASYFNARVTAYENAVVGVSGLAPQPPFGAAANLASGIAIIPDPGLLEFYEAFSYETAPSGLTSVNLTDSAFAVQTAFSGVASAILVYQGNDITQLYDVAIRQAMTAGVAAQTLQAATAGGFDSNVSGLNTWNQIVTLPAMTMVSDMYNGAPYTIQNQQNAVIRNTMLSLAQQIAVYLLIQRRPLVSQVQLTILRVNESLMDVASRTLGDFSRWVEIATLNGLVPPYVGLTSSQGIAGWGSKLLLPTPGSSLSALGTPPDYETNFLGVDKYVGPINGSMPMWTGDFQTIKGYSNLAWALGRRIQTTLGTLLYHLDFGSRIPPHVGDIQLPQTTQHIAIQGKSALLSDPRVAAVPAAIARPLGIGAVAFSANVQPAGSQGNAINVNEVISTLP